MVYALKKHKEMNSKNEYTIRNASADDLADILHLFEESIRMTCSDEYTLKQINAWVGSSRDREKWMNRIDKDLFIVSERAGQITGFASLKGKDHVDLLYVHPRHQRKGIAQRLLQTLTREARKRPVSRLSTLASLTALAFFKKMGFHTVRKNEVIREEVSLTNFEMIYRFE